MAKRRTRVYRVRTGAVAPTLVAMNLNLLKTLTWSTVAAAIASALALAAAEPGDLLPEQQQAVNDPARAAATPGAAASAPVAARPIAGGG